MAISERRFEVPGAGLAESHRQADQPAAESKEKERKLPRTQLSEALNVLGQEPSTLSCSIQVYKLINIINVHKYHSNQVSSI